jgi:trigger factor
LNIQVERLDTQEALITVELDEKYVDQAKRKAAAYLSARYRIPGFRKGKAPYNVVQTILGEDAIVEIATDQIADDIYPKALRQSGLKPYASGVLEEAKLAPVAIYRFRVPLQPEVDLGNYRSVRVPYNEPSVSDEEVDEVIRSSRKPTRVPFEGDTLEAGLLVTLDVDSELADGDERPADQETTTDSAGKVFYRGDSWITGRDEVVRLDHDHEPFMSGFVDQLIGQKVGDTIEFELTADEYAEVILGRKVRFKVTIKKAERELPVELDDELAAELTKDERPPLTLDQLRERVRNNLLLRRQRDYRIVYFANVVDAIAAQSTLLIPKKMVEDRIDQMVEELKQNMLRNGISYERYKEMLNMTDEQIRDKYREEAEQFVRRSVVVTEIAKREDLVVTKDEIDSEIERMVADQKPRDAARLRSHFNRREQRDEIADSLVMKKVNDFLVKLGRGELPAAQDA